MSPKPEERPAPKYHCTACNKTVHIVHPPHGPDSRVVLRSCDHHEAGIIASMRATAHGEARVAG